MFEVTLLFLVMLVIAVCAFLPVGCSVRPSAKSYQQSAAGDSCSDSELIVPVDSTSKQSFLTHLQSEIESALFPRPTDSILQRHYDALVNAELENRLAAMPDS
ncbi:hypothetical protein [Methylobacter tundripaludum]|uniref:Uncharacterized protein n=1 Tax=Methylobacter tundripaludum (strain ATCC BAA-1195 / DSM 17260 / SV96) TaxID=697282 RepID=G3J1B6_METTV|nr:hypothetical protein [Methylobacter tundripaludum]EGW20988.1 hypothetical protein Mettu_4141 [Methylobacter tundripaludum SV96]